jgi:hypothetical protein
MHCPQVAATFSAGSAVAVLGGGFLFCRVQAAGRRNLTFLLCAMTAGAPSQPCPAEVPQLQAYVQQALCCSCSTAAMVLCHCSSTATLCHLPQHGLKNALQLANQPCQKSHHALACVHLCVCTRGRQCRIATLKVLRPAARAATFVGLRTPGIPAWATIALVALLGASVSVPYYVRGALDCCSKCCRHASAP